MEFGKVAFFATLASLHRIRQAITGAPVRVVFQPIKKATNGTTDSGGDPHHGGQLAQGTGGDHRTGHLAG